MGYKFTEKKKHDTEEKAYITYMMAASYFNHCLCKTPALEERLFLYYKEMGMTKQLRMEEKIIELLESKVSGHSTKLAIMNAEAFIAGTEGHYTITFKTGFEKLVIEVGGDVLCSVEDEAAGGEGCL